jgi:tyrosinase
MLHILTLIAADPLFWVHHANVDRFWWSWQIRDLKKREKDISGPLVNFDYENKAAGNVTLNHGIFIGETVKLKAKVRDVMHIKKGLLCYEYEDTY